MSEIKKVHVLCSGGAGYIGSHTVLQLLATKRYTVTIVDDLSNASQKCVDVLEKLAGEKIPFIKLDLTDKQAVLDLFKTHKFDAVIDYAAKKSVGESVAKPLEYYWNNVNALLNILFAMRETDCKTIVFSSSACVYQPSALPIPETYPVGSTNPYGGSKVMCEQILSDLNKADNSFKMCSLRYFNPVGCHESGEMGEAPDVPMNLLPIIQQVAVGRRDHLDVCGADWDTPDKTGVRDYLHVLDLADGHIAALDALINRKEGCHNIYNLGTGKGVSVYELIKLFETASGVTIKRRVVGRRPGDLAFVVADCSLAEKELGWKAHRTVAQACESAWKWQSTHPYGFGEQPPKA